MVAGNINIYRMVLSPLGIHLIGSHKDFDWDSQWQYAQFPDVSVERYRGRNIRFDGLGGGHGSDGFDFYLYADSPIDVGEVTGIIIDGVHIPMPAR
jgi:hypothetical protein